MVWGKKQSSFQNEEFIIKYSNAFREIILLIKRVLCMYTDASTYTPEYKSVYTLAPGGGEGSFNY